MEFYSCADRYHFWDVYTAIYLFVPFTHLPYEKSVEMGFICYDELCHSHRHSGYRFSHRPMLTSPKAMGPENNRKLLAKSYCCQCRVLQWRLVTMLFSWMILLSIENY